MSLFYMKRCVFIVQHRWGRVRKPIYVPISAAPQGKFRTFMSSTHVCLIMGRTFYMVKDPGSSTLQRSPFMFRPSPCNTEVRD